MLPMIDKPMRCDSCRRIFECADMVETDDGALVCVECYKTPPMTREDYLTYQADVLHASGETDNFGRRRD